MQLTINSINETYIHIDAEPSVIHELSDVFCFEVPNARFMPKYKAGLWDGMIRLINTRAQTTYKGLVPEIRKFCKQRNYAFHLSNEFRQAFKETLDFDAGRDLILPDNFEIRDFQKHAIDTVLNKKRTIIISSTGSGKSFIIYALARALSDSKFLIITTTTTAVDQMASDFDDYSVNDTAWHVDDQVHRIYSGQEHDTDKPIVIATWQSIHKKSKKWLGQFTAVVGDECHTYDAKACTAMMTKMTNAFYRIGTTGTLKDSKSHRLSLTGLFGPPVTVSETQELIDRGILPQMQINFVVLKHHQDDISDRGILPPISKLKYQDEINYIVSNERRRQFVANMCHSVSGNVLFLYALVEKHGKPQSEVIEEFESTVTQDGVGGNKTVYFIHGPTPTWKRRRIQAMAEERNDLIIVASYGTFQQAININNLHHVILGAPTKSKIRVLQSIGRGLRRGENKEAIKVWDLVDDLRMPNIKTTNFALKHFEQRHALYSENKFNIHLHNKKL